MINQSIKIVVNAPYEEVFKYISNLKYDKYWRTEVISTSSQTDLGVGGVAIESSFLSNKIPQYVRRLECKSFRQNEMIVYQTFPGDPHYLNSSRTVQICEGGSTMFIYRLEFDPAIVKHALGFTLPKILIDIITRRSMRSYMKNLKRILEPDL